MSFTLSFSDLYEQLIVGCLFTWTRSSGTCLLFSDTRIGGMIQSLLTLTCGPALLCLHGYSAAGFRSLCVTRLLLLTYNKKHMEQLFIIWHAHNPLQSFYIWIISVPLMSVNCKNNGPAGWCHEKQSFSIEDSKVPLYSDLNILQSFYTVIHSYTH